MPKIKKKRFFKKTNIKELENIARNFSIATLITARQADKTSLL